MIVGLPMYDRPETAAAHDRYWQAIRDSLRAMGVPCPDDLDRDIGVWTLWQAADLVLAQTCGLPFRARLHGKVALVGTPDFGLPGLNPGYYQSVILTRADDPRQDLAAFRGAVLAYNEPLSQSGWSAPCVAAQKLGFRFEDPLRTGAHRNSARAVADGRADLAAIDAITWRDLTRYDPDITGRLHVLTRTDPTPGLPYITSMGQDPALIARAVRTAIEGLAAGDRDVLGLRGLVGIPAAEYVALPIPPAP